MEIDSQNIYARSHFVSQNGIQSYDDIKTVINDAIKRASKLEKTKRTIKNGQ
jgi:hypothetical protein